MNPTDARSQFRILGLRTPTTNSIEIRWRAVPARTYRVQSTSDVSGTTWTSVPSGRVVASTDPAGRPCGTDAPCGNRGGSTRLGLS